MTPKYTEFLKLAVSALAKRDNGIRRGQCLFNALEGFDSVAACAIRNSGADPYYRDDRIADFYTFLLTYWKNGSCQADLPLDANLPLSSDEEFVQRFSRFKDKLTPVHRLRLANDPNYELDLASLFAAAIDTLATEEVVPCSSSPI